jgi:hypothetical protein
MGFTLAAASIVMADDTQKKGARAPADFVVFKSERAGAYFIAKPLMDQYEGLLRQVGALRAEINEARITGSEARRQIDRLQGELEALIRKIDVAKLYIPGAPVHTKSVTTSFVLGADDVLFIECSNVEIQGSDGPEVRCVLEKVVLGEGETEVADDFAGIELISRRRAGKELFGFYVKIAGRAEWKADWDRFPFKDYLDQDFEYLTVKGLTHEEGNRQIQLEMHNEQGAGVNASEWRRHAKFTVFVPKCRRVGVRGALGGFKVSKLNASLSVEGNGNRDYGVTYEVTDLVGALAADNIPIHHIDGIHGNASIIATAYAGNTSTTYDARGVTMTGEGPKASVYRNIDGDLQVRTCRADLLLERITGRIDVENDFGRTIFVAHRPLAQQDHRLVSQSGTIELRLGGEALGSLGVGLFTECGVVHLDPETRVAFETKMFTSAIGDIVQRSWHGFVRKQDHGTGGGPDLFDRVSAVLLNRPRAPGLDVISRGGTILLSSPGKEAGK